MKIYANGKEFNIKLDADFYWGIEEGRTLTAFLPQKKFDKVHKLFADRLPKDRNTWVEFDWELTNVTLHVTGSNDKIFYKEGLTAEFNDNEKELIERVTSKFEQT